MSTSQNINSNKEREDSGLLGYDAELFLLFWKIKHTSGNLHH